MQGIIVQVESLIELHAEGSKAPLTSYSLFGESSL